MSVYYPGWYSISYMSFIFLLSVHLQKGSVMSWQEALIISAIAFFAWLIVFVMQGIGLYKQAKKANFKRKALCFVPFAQVYVTGALSGEVSFYGHRVKNLGLYAMIAEMVASAYYVVYSVATYVLFVENGQYCELVEGYPQWSYLSDSAIAWKGFYEISSFLPHHVDQTYRLQLSLSSF